LKNRYLCLFCKKNPVKISKVFLLALLMFLPGCRKKNSPGLKPGLYKQTLTIDGTRRRYGLYIPEGTDGEKIPLVIELHGGGVYIEDMTGESGHKSPYKLWMPLADREKFIVVYPEGLDGAYGKPTWNDCRADCSVYSTANDVHFIEVLINRLSGQYPVDLHRIYVSGTSNGGFMAQRLACELTEYIAAMASVAAAKPAVSRCRPPDRPVSVLFMNGTDDNHMPYQGGLLSNPPDSAHGTVLSTPETIDFWVRFNHCDTIPQYRLFADRDPDDGGIPERYIYANGTEQTEVILYKINGGGHSAPSIREQFSPLYEQYFNKQNHDIEMTAEVWNFFKRHRR
jgi:polyhydroxybutyrate depolymerase